MTRLTLAEEVMLLSLDDDSGAAKAKDGTHWALAGGALVELVLAGRVEVEDDRAKVVDASPLGVPHLDTALAAIVEKGPELKVKKAMERAKCVREGTTESLIARGLVREEKKKVLGLFPVTRYPEADGAPEEELRARLGAVVLRGDDPDERTASLVALIRGAKLGKLAFPGEDRRKVDSRMEEIAKGQWVQPAVRRAIDQAEAIIIAVVVSSTGAGAAGI
ncbi:GPP34 family phosphoprotein [Streptomyces sp. RKND-216]|uniref:GOLPH3/VPS74 family protein n=1 Tax=Streptomyces sp. RKND-216 TaxID=2562581 RepID=UPI00109D9575|nr:GPP34 family phosphoprotein [Streptomyces sp. RKND-216]THA24806.1 GPP34 family phosphoprotein [Streptomyces sp. RKND-216]